MRQGIGGALQRLLLITLISLPAQVHSAGLVSIDGALTEIVYALGAEDRLVGVDTTSVYPEAAQSLPQVGYMRQLSAEGILSLQPDLVLATRDAGPEPVFEQLRAAGVQVVRIEAYHTLEGVLDKVMQVGRALQLPDTAEQLATRIRAQAGPLLAAIPDSPSATLFLMGSGNHGLMAAGQETRAQAFLQLVGADNVAEYRGYRPIGQEGAVLMQPEVVLAGFSAQPGGGAENAGLLKTLGATPAAKHQRIHTVDLGKTLGFGPRIGEVLAEVLPLLYPQAEFASTD